MKRFDRIRSDFLRVILEQPVDPMAAAPSPADPAQPPVDLGAAAPDPSATDDVEGEVQPLSPEAEVYLVKLVRRALTVELSLEDQSKLLGLVPAERDITESNAKDVLKQLEAIVISYSSGTESQESDKNKLNI